MSSASAPPDATRVSYDRVAAAYASHVAGELDGKPLDRALLDVVVELAGDGIIADIGCGPGHVAGWLASTGGRVVGLDLSPAMCRLAAQATALPFCAADMTALPVRAGAFSAVVSLYAVIHLDVAERAAAYREFARVLRPGGHALIAFHTSDADVHPGGFRELAEWFDREVQLTFRFLDPTAESAALLQAGLTAVARLDRQHHPEVEYPSERSYLLVRRSDPDLY